MYDVAVMYFCRPTWKFPQQKPISIFASACRLLEKIRSVTIKSLFILLVLFIIFTNNREHSLHLSVFEVYWTCVYICGGTIFLSDMTHMVSVLCVYSVSVYAYRVSLGWMDTIFCDCLTNTQSHEHCPQPWEISAHQPPLRWLFIPLSLTPSSSLTLSILSSFTLSSCASGFHSMNVTQCLSLCKIGLLGSITDVSLPDFREIWSDKPLVQ